MGKALAAVGGILALFFVVFGGVVYVTRDEDTIAVDPLLAERITQAVVEANQVDGQLDLRGLTPFDWDRVFVYPPGTSNDTISRAVGFEFKGDLPYTVESSEVFVFTNQGRFVRFADYRGRGQFEGLRRPVDTFTAGEAVFEVRDLVVRPRR
jgi:hypothetical protein